MTLLRQSTSSQHLRYLHINSQQSFFLISYELSRELEPPVDPCPGSPNHWSHRLISKKLTSWVLLFTVSKHRFPFYGLKTPIYWWHTEVFGGVFAQE